MVLGLRAGFEGISVAAMGVITACYFIGFGLGSFVCPRIVDSAGPIRSFAALASVISGVTLAHPLLPDPLSWGLMRLVIGFCFAGLYMVVQSWLNARASNVLRGRVLSIYGTAAFAGYRSLRRPAPKASAGEETPAPIVAANPGTVPLDPSYEEGHPAPRA